MTVMASSSNSLHLLNVVEQFIMAAEKALASSGNLHDLTASVTSPRVSLVQQVQAEGVSF